MDLNNVQELKSELRKGLFYFLTSTLSDFFVLRFILNLSLNFFIVKKTLKFFEKIISQERHIIINRMKDLGHLLSVF